MVSRLVFEVKRRAGFPEPAFMATIVMPAQTEGLRGEFVAQTKERYTAVLEGPKEATERFESYIATLEAAVGEVSGMRVTHHHDSYAFPSRAVRMVFFE